MPSGVWSGRLGGGQERRRSLVKIVMSLNLSFRLVPGAGGRGRASMKLVLFAYLGLLSSWTPE